MVAENTPASRKLSQMDSVNPPTSSQNAPEQFASNSSRFSSVLPSSTDSKTRQSEPASQEDPGNRFQWGTCAEVMKKHDEEMIHGWREDIDTSLVFAGLFSAVLTGFVVISYLQLQPDPQDTTNLLLQRILERLSEYNTDVPQAGVSRTASAFRPTPSAIRLNAWWFSSLVFSLFSAMVGLLAKQWLREYLRQGFASPRSATRLRQYRFEGLIRWRIGHVIGFMPIMLEIALVLFLVGIVEFLWALDNIVAGINTIIVAAALSFYLGTMVIPAFAPSSPFKSPQAWAFCSFLWGVIPRRLFSWTYFPERDEETYAYTDANVYLPGSWEERDYRFTRHYRQRLDHGALVWTCSQTSNGDIIDRVAPCANNLPPSLASSIIFETIAKKAECSVSVLVNSIRATGPQSHTYVGKFMSRAGRSGIIGITRMLLDLLPRMTLGQAQDPSQATALDALHVLRRLLTALEGAACDLPIHRRTLDTLTWLTNRHVPPRVQREALSLLHEMTQGGCNWTYCPTGMSYVADYALTALARDDSEAFNQACSILLARVPIGAQNCTAATGSTPKEWLYSLSHILETLLHREPMPRLAHVSRMNWCSGFAAISRFDKTTSGAEEDLVSLLEAAIAAGLVLYDTTEEAAMNELRARRAS